MHQRLKPQKIARRAINMTSTSRRWSIVSPIKSIPKQDDRRSTEAWDGAELDLFHAKVLMNVTRTRAIWSRYCIRMPKDMAKPGKLCCLFEAKNVWMEVLRNHCDVSLAQVSLWNLETGLGFRVRQHKRQTLAIVHNKAYVGVWLEMGNRSWQYSYLNRCTYKIKVLPTLALAFEMPLNVSQTFSHWSCWIIDELTNLVHGTLSLLKAIWRGQAGGVETSGLAERTTSYLQVLQSNQSLWDLSNAFHVDCRIHALRLFMTAR